MPCSVFPEDVSNGFLRNDYVNLPTYTASRVKCCNNAFTLSNKCYNLALKFVQKQAWFNSKVEIPHLIIEYIGDSYVYIFKKFCLYVKYRSQLYRPIQFLIV